MLLVEGMCQWVERFNTTESRLRALAEFRQGLVPRQTNHGDANLPAAGIRECGIGNCADVLAASPLKNVFRTSDLIAVLGVDRDE